VGVVVWVLVMTYGHLVLYQVDVDIQYGYEIDARHEVHLDVRCEVDNEYVPSQQRTAPSYLTQVLPAMQWEPPL
jgi:hypothetical protein